MVCSEREPEESQVFQVTEVAEEDERDQQGEEVGYPVCACVCVCVCVHVCVCVDMCVGAHCSIICTMPTQKLGFLERLYTLIHICCQACISPQSVHVSKTHCGILGNML